MAELIDRDKAIEKLREIQAAHARRSCSRTSIVQADAIGYAIEVIRRLPAVSSDETND